MEKLSKDRQVANGDLRPHNVAVNGRINAERHNAQHGQQSTVHCALQEFLVDLHVLWGAKLKKWTCDVRAALDDDRNVPPFPSTAGSLGGGVSGSGDPGEAPRVSREREAGDKEA